MVQIPRDMKVTVRELGGSIGMVYIILEKDIGNTTIHASVSAYYTISLGTFYSAESNDISVYVVDLKMFSEGQLSSSSDIMAICRI